MEDIVGTCVRFILCSSPLSDVVRLASSVNPPYSVCSEVSGSISGTGVISASKQSRFWEFMFTASSLLGLVAEVRYAQMNPVRYSPSAVDRKYQLSTMKRTAGGFEATRCTNDSFESIPFKTNSNARFQSWSKKDTVETKHSIWGSKTLKMSSIDAVNVADTNSKVATRTKVTCSNLFNSGLLEALSSAKKKRLSSLEHFSDNIVPLSKYVLVGLVWSALWPLLPHIYTS